MITLNNCKKHNAVIKHASLAPCAKDVNHFNSFSALQIIYSVKHH